jgi:hypothetical protein
MNMTQIISNGTDCSSPTCTAQSSRPPVDLTFGLASTKLLLTTCDFVFNEIMYGSS